MDQVEPVFKLGDKRYKLKITMGMATKDLPDKFDMDILSMFCSEERMQQAMQKMVFDDSGALRLMHYFVEKESGFTYERMLEDLSDLAVVDEFRDAFWAAIVNFSGPLKKKILMQMWQEFKKELKEADLAKNDSDA
jgi:hypothetical protein